MGKTLGRVAFEIWMGGSVPDEHWNDKPEYARQQWESIAAAVAAEVRREMGWRPIAEAPEHLALFVGVWERFLDVVMSPAGPAAAGGKTVIAQWRPIAEAPDDRALFVGAWDELGVWCRQWPMSRAGAIDVGYTHYLPQPDPPPQEQKS